MAILNPYGFPAREMFARSVNTNSNRGPIFRRGDASINRLIPSGDRKALAALSRRVVFNTGPAAETIRQKASWSTKGAWVPSYGGDDSDAGKAAEGWLGSDFFPVMDLAGRCRSLRSWLSITSKAIDRDGESFQLLTRNPETGAPRVQMIPAFQVRSDDNASLTGTPYDGAGLTDGIGVDDDGRVLFYRVHSSDKDFDDIPAASMIHLFNQDYPEQRRGFPAFAASLSDILQGLESKELEILRQILVSSVLLYNKGGSPPTPQEGGFDAVTNTTTGEAIIKEQVSAGIHYLNHDQEIGSITHDNPGDLWSNFQERLWKEAVIGAGWSYQLVSIGGKPSQGTVARAEVVRARMAVDCRVDILAEAAKRIVTYALSDPSAPALETFEWAFSWPARMSVDDGREDRALLEALKARAISFGDYQATKGRTRREALVELAKDKLDAANVAREFSTPETPITAEELLIPEAHQEAPVMEKPL